MYTECPHCSAIFTLPSDLETSKVRCGECGTIFDTEKAKADLLPPASKTSIARSRDSEAVDIDAPPPTAELDLTTMDLSEIEKIDAEINNTLDAELKQFVSTTPDDVNTNQQLDQDFLYESKTARKLGDTLELPVLDDMDYTDHSDAARRNDFAETLDQVDANQDEFLADDIFDEFISSEEIVNPDEGTGITSKASGEKIDDSEDILPDIDIDIESTSPLANINAVPDKLATTADDLLIQEAPRNSVFSDLEDLEAHSSEIALPDFEDMPALPGDVDQVVDELRASATNDNVLRDVPFPPEAQDQQALELDTQPELPGLDKEALDDEETTSDGLDNLISLEQFDQENAALETRRSKREFLYEHRRAIGFGTLFTVLFLTLAGQYIRQNREQFKHYAATRPLTKAVCSISDCLIEPLRQSGKIKILEHSIFPHKIIENALTIKAKVINNAGEAQPFPVLQVNFFNLAGEKIGTRRFGPNEYLNKLPRRNGLMPDNEAVFFEFDIADPGRDGVSFDLLIR